MCPCCWSFFEYDLDPAMLDHWGGILCDIHGRIKRWMIYNNGNLVYSKIATVLLICITYAEAVGNTSLYSPYTGQEIPDETT